MIQKFSIKNKNLLKHRPYYKNLPKHILFIPDGNRRYARQHKIDDMRVYELAKNTCLDLIEVCFHEYNLDNLSIFFLRPSTFDKQSRSSKNLAAILIKINEAAQEILQGKTKINPNEVHIEAITLAGKPWMQPPQRIKSNPRLVKLWQELTMTMKQFKKNKKSKQKKINFLLNYSGKAELDIALKTGQIQISDQIGLAIRVGDGMRLSDCPLYALSEAHFALIEKYLPAVKKSDFRKIISKYYEE